MTESSSRMQISYLAMLGWVVPFGLVAGCPDLYVTSRIAGTEGVRAGIAAWIVTSAVVLLSGWFVVLSARKGPQRAAFVFIVAGMLRAVIVLLLVAAVWAVLKLMPIVLLVWALIFYCSMLAGEVAWLARALNRDAHRVHLGEIKRPSEQKLKNLNKKD
ncbi:MAG: hypothetical protein ACLFVU_06205 [Phycisphaerae bacterium]